MTMPLSMLSSPMAGMPSVSGGDAKSGSKLEGSVSQYLARNAPFVVSGQGGTATNSGGLEAEQGGPGGGLMGGGSGQIVLIAGIVFIGILLAVK